MKKFLATVLLAVLAGLPCSGLSDTLPRVVSLDLCTDWMLAAYADRQQVLALSPLVRQYPVDWLGNDWPLHDGSLEQLLQLAPDLVIAGEYNARLLRQRLQQFGIRVEVLRLPQSLQQIDAYRRHFFDLLGRDSGKTAVVTDNATVPAASQPRLLLLGANGIAPGGDTLEDDILQAAGWRNYVTESGFVTVDLEHLVADPPDALIWAAPAQAAQANRLVHHPVLRRLLPASRWLQTGFWRWQCPGPWSYELIEQLQQWREH